MSNLRKKSAEQKNVLTFKIISGYFGLRIIGSLPKHLKQELLPHATYWSAHHIDEYFQDRGRPKPNPHALQGWYYHHDAILILKAKGHYLDIK